MSKPMSTLGGGLLGAVVAGVLAFVVGSILPACLTPGGNLGPLTGCFVIPIGGVVGGVVGSGIAQSKTSNLRLFLSAAIAGLILIVILFALRSRQFGGIDNLIYLACVLACFGITSTVVQAACMIDRSGDPEKR